MKDKCSSWENGSKEVISFVRSRLLAAFQDLETITNKVEVHGIILRAVLGTRFFSLERIEMGTHAQSRCWPYAWVSSISKALSGMQLYFAHANDVDSPMYDHSIAFLSVLINISCI